MIEDNQRNFGIKATALALVLLLHSTLIYQAVYAFGHSEETTTEINVATQLVMHEIYLQTGDVPSELVKGNPEEEIILDESSKELETLAENENKEDSGLSESDPELVQERLEDLSEEKQVTEPLIKKEIIATKESNKAQKVVPKKIAKPEVKQTPKPISKPKIAQKSVSQPKKITTPSSSQHSQKESKSASAISPNKVFSESEISVLNKPVPSYPRAARQRRLQGVVYLIVNINERGIVNWVRVSQSSGHTLLDKAAEQAARKIRLKPYIVNGQAHAINVSIPYQFQI